MRSNQEHCKKTQEIIEVTLSITFYDEKMKNEGRNTIEKKYASPLIPIFLD